MAPVARFALEKRLPSCRVTRTLLLSLEQYLKGKKEDLKASLKFDPDTERFTISVSDALGVETVGSVLELRGDRFLDSTMGVDINFEANWHKLQTELLVNLRFRVDRSLSRLTIEARGNAPRELVVGAYRSLSDIIETNKTSNYLYHLPSGPEAVLVVGWSLPIVVGVLLGGFRSIQALVGLTLGLLILAYLSLGKWFRPYTVFDSNRTDRLDKLGTWFFFGVLSFLVFETGMVFLRHWLVGF